MTKGILINYLLWEMELIGQRFIHFISVFNFIWYMCFILLVPNIIHDVLSLRINSLVLKLLSCSPMIKHKMRPITLLFEFFYCYSWIDIFLSDFAAIVIRSFVIELLIVIEVSQLCAMVFLKMQWMCWCKKL